MYITIEKLERGGYINRTEWKRPYFFELTERGRQILLNISEGEPLNFQPFFRLHNCRWAFPVVEGHIDIEHVPLRLKTVHIKGWDYHTGRALNVSFRFLPPSNTIEIYAVGLRGSNVDELKIKSLLNAVKFSQYLEDVLKVRFGQPRKACKFHIAVINDPLVSVLGNKETVRDGDLWIDASGGKPELEFGDHKLLQTYLFMINKFDVVLDMAKKLPEFVENQKKLGSEIDRSIALSTSF